MAIPLRVSGLLSYGACALIVVFLNNKGKIQTLPLSRVFIVSFNAINSVILRVCHMRRWPCKPLNDPRWQSAHKGIDVNHWPCSISWHSLIGGASQTAQGIDLIVSICFFSSRVGEALFLLCNVNPLVCCPCLKPRYEFTGSRDPEFTCLLT